MPKPLIFRMGLWLYLGFSLGEGSGLGLCLEKVFGFSGESCLVSQQQWYPAVVWAVPCGNAVLDTLLSPRRRGYACNAVFCELSVSQHTVKLVGSHLCKKVCTPEVSYF